MQLYTNILIFYAQRWLVYPIEVLTELLKYFIKIFALYLFWYLVLEGSGNQQDIDSLISYFLIAAGVSTITMTRATYLGKDLRDHIKNGDINNFLIKPVKILPYYYFRSWGKRLALILIVVIGSIVAIVLEGQLKLVNIGYFLVFLFFAMVLGICLNILEGVLTFYVTEVSGIKNMVLHIIRVFSGMLIPLSFFPEGLRSVVELTPFPAMIYGPTQALLSENPQAELGQSLIVSVVWSVIFVLTAFTLWRQAIRSYEGTGA